MIVPGIGAFVGFVLGALIGNLFGRKKPRIPTANAEVYLDYTSDKFSLGVSSASNGGNLELVKSMAISARDTLNGFLSVLTGDFDYDTATGYNYNYNLRGVQYNGGTAATYYGHTAGQLWVKYGASNAAQNNVASADEAVSKGVIWSLDRTSIIGGDIFAKRALANSPATDLTALLGDLQIAADYRFYAENRELINGYITGAYNTLKPWEEQFYADNKSLVDRIHMGEPLTADQMDRYDLNKVVIDKIIGALEDQAIANPWIITLQRISELKLDQWSYGDFNGGLGGFLMSMGLERKGVYLEDIAISAQAGGAVISVEGRTDVDGVFSLLPQAFDGPANNEVLNPRWQQGMAGWGMHTHLAPTAERGVNLNADWSGNGNDVMWARINGAPTVGAVVDNASDWISTQAGRAYEFSVKAAQHRGIAQMYVQFVDANHQHISYEFMQGAARDYGGGQGHLDNFNTLSAQVVAPPGTAYHRVITRLYATGESDPYAFFTQPTAREIVNDVENPRWQHGLMNWQLTSHAAAAPHHGVNLDANWSGNGNDVLWMHMGGTPVVNAHTDSRSDFIETEAGLTYEMSVMAAQHRGYAQMFVEFYDENKVGIGHAFGSGAVREFGGQHGHLANYDRLSVQAVAPPGTVYRRIGLRLLAHGGDSPYAFFTQPESRVVAADAFDWDGRGNSLRIEDLSKIGYTQLQNGNTSGRDFIDKSGSVVGVELNDYQSETRYEGSWQWQGWGPPPEIQMLPGHDDPNWVWVEQEVTYVTSGGDDIFIGGQGEDILRGYGGDDWLNGNGNDDHLEGGAGNDVLLGGDGRDALFGQDGDDYLVAGNGDDNPWNSGRHAGMWGGNGNDILVMGAGIDAAFGEAGDDIFLMDQDGYRADQEFSHNPAYNHGQMDYVDAGVGSDTVSYERFNQPITGPLDANHWPWATNLGAMPAGGINGVRVALWHQPAGWDHDPYWADVSYVMGDWLKGIENVTGSRFNDYLWGDAANNVLKGGDGDDFLDGHFGHDILEGGAGADFMYSAGDGTLSYEGSTAGVFIDMTTGEAFGGHATGDRWNAMDHITGSRFSDDLKGDAGSNRIKGLGGDDWMVATAGNDAFEGGDGLDTVDYSEATSGVSLTLGNTAEGNVTTGSGHGGLAYGHTYLGVEAVLGSSHADSLYGGAGSQEFMGGKGDDVLAGGEGSDTYYFERGDGFDQIVEDNSGSNTLSFGSDIKIGDLGFGWQSHAHGVFEMWLHDSPSDRVRIQGNVQTYGNNKLKTIDLNGAGQIDVSLLERCWTGWGGDDVLRMDANVSGMMAGYGGNDYIFANGTGGWTDKSSVVIGGAGNDVMYGSVGDEQYVFDRGDGSDIINDTGGEDTLVFGATVQADDVRVEIQGVDMLVYYNPDNASDHVRIQNGGYSHSTVEFINAGGTWIDIRKLDIAWVDGGASFSGIAPIVLDLGGDGLDLIGVEQSSVVTRAEDGDYARMGWVAATDGMLVMDRNGDGHINRTDEISFIQDVAGAKTDLEGLRAWDSNGDGKLTSADAAWGEFRIWVDGNQNGRSTVGELRTLDEAGITGLDLTGRATGYTSDLTRDNFVHNTLSFTWNDGSSGTGYDVVLGRKRLEDEEIGEITGGDPAIGEMGQLRSRAGTTHSTVVSVQPVGLDGLPLHLQPGLIGSRGSLSQHGSNGISRDLVEAGLPFDPRAWAAYLDPMDFGSETVIEPTVEVVSQEPTGHLLDFTDHDDLHALPKQPVGFIDPDTPATGSMSNDPTHRGANGRSFARPDLMPEVPHDAITGDEIIFEIPQEPTFATGDVSREPISAFEPTIGRTSRPEFAHHSPQDLDQAAAVLSRGPSSDADLWGAAPVSLAGARTDAAWWRMPAPALEESTDRAGTTERGDVADGLSVRPVAGPASLVQDRQALLQAIAGFKGRGGMAPAVWTRNGDGSGMETSVAGGNRNLTRASLQDRGALV